ncbi:hypothetical protein P4U07_28900 [Bacillus mycoides]|uniref:hypothetical protein n=1 Tax=Bacillus mycoides TaxID=1405 RepID=UPI002E1E37E7|nr:hypothetical protein [Bacillus mycoides]
MSCRRRIIINWPPPSGFGFDIRVSVRGAVDKIRERVESGAKTLEFNQVETVLQNFTEQAKQLGEDIITEQGQQYVAAIEDLQEKIRELTDQFNQLNIEKIKREILGKAEEFCEAYLQEHVSLPEDLPIKTHPRVIIDFNSNRIKIQIEIFVMKQEDPENTYRRNYLVVGSVQVNQQFNQTLQIPKFVPEINPNLVQNEVDKIMEEIERQKDEKIEKVVKSVMEDFVPVLKLLNDKYLKIF